MSFPGWRGARLAAIAAAVSLTTLASLASADDVTVARARFDEAKAAFGAGRYAEAAEAYEQSAAAKPHPAPFVNAAEAWELDGNFVRAAQACDRAFVLTTDASLRATIQQRLVRLSKRIATLSLRGVAGTAASIDGGEPVDTPARLRLSPGRHHLAYLAPSGARSGDEEVLLAPGEERAIVLSDAQREPPPAPVASTAAPPPAPPPSPPAAKGPPAASWVAFGVGVVAGGVAGVFAVQTLSAKSAYENGPSRDTLDDFYAKRRITNVSLGVAGVAAITGIVVWLLQPAQARAAMRSGDLALLIERTILP